MSIDDRLQELKEDRRLLPYVPDVTGRRTNADRRQASEQDKIRRDQDYEKYIASAEAGRRFKVKIPVRLTYTAAGKKRVVSGTCMDISSTGMLFIADDEKAGTDLPKEAMLSFEIRPGDMPEGYEMKVKGLSAEVVRAFDKEGHLALGLHFSKSLVQYYQSKRGKYLIAVSAFLLLCISLVILLMRSESVIYFRFNKFLYLYSIITAGFLLTRYFFAIFYKPVPVDIHFTPGVSIIVPCFNEETWIQRTVLSCMNQDYPPDKLQVIVVDDCSTDRSVEKVEELIRKLDEDDPSAHIRDRLTCFV